MDQLLQQNTEDFRYIQGAPKVNLSDIPDPQIPTRLVDRLLMAFCAIYVGMCLAYDKSEY